MSSSDMSRPAAVVPSKMPGTLPELHRGFLDNAVKVLREDCRIVGVAAAGSFVGDVMDAFSDLDLVLAVEPSEQEAVLGDRQRIAGTLGNLLAAFTGEHVGEPRLLICLYGDPLLHVDLKFVALPDLARRIEDPIVLFERDGRMTAALATSPAERPRPDRQWIEDRFWIWVHYAATKIGRGELYETIEFLCYLRDKVLAPLAAERAGLRPTGVRRIEGTVPEVARQLRATLAGHDAADCRRAVRACVDLYRTLRADDPTVTPRSQAERAATVYLDTIGNPEPA
jgi:hypothetical protein